MFVVFSIDVPRFFYQDACALAPSHTFGDKFMRNPVAGVSEAVNLCGTNIELTSNAVILIPSRELGPTDLPVPRLTDNPGFERPFMDIPACKFEALLKLMPPAGSVLLIN